MDPGILVPPRGYGGIERLVDTLAKEYTRQGHEVHLLVTTGSKVEGAIVHGYGEEGFPQTRTQSIKGLIHVWKFLWQNYKSFNLVHNFGRLAYLLPILNKPVKKITTYQREIRPRNIRYVNALPNKLLVFTGCSADLISRTLAIGHWETVYNTIDFSKYTFTSQSETHAPLMFLGRLERVKGCHIAIAVAKKTGRKLVIAGNTSPLKEELAYFKKEIEPHIDNDRIKYIGEVNDRQKNEWLARSVAMLFPIIWNEPFGIVMIEAMACGTPVIAFNKGSVDEVIEEGVTGYKTVNFEEMCAAVEKIEQVDRFGCRQAAMKNFDAPVIARQYLSL